MQFTQYLRPNGKKQPVVIDRPEDIEIKVKEIEELGYKFEIEVLSTGIVHMDCCDSNEQIYSELCNNGPTIVDYVDNLVNVSYQIIKEGRND